MYVYPKSLLKSLPVISTDLSRRKHSPLGKEQEFYMRRGRGDLLSSVLILVLETGDDEYLTIMGPGEESKHCIPTDDTMNS